MKPWLLLGAAIVLPGGFILLAAAWWRRRRDVPAVSAQWLREQDRRDERVEFHGVGWRWPVKKIANEQGWFNRQRLRKVS